MTLLHPRAAPSDPARPAVERIAGDASRVPNGAGPRRLDDRCDVPGVGFAIDRLDAVDAVAHREAWVDLAARALEPNVFLDPDFALPAAQHLAGRRRPCFVLVWAVEGGERRDLVAVCPVVGRRAALRGLASTWMHDLSTLGFPMLDRARAVPALAALLGWAADDLRAASGLVIPSLPADGPTAAALRQVAAEGGLEIAVLDTWERAALHGGPAGRAALSAKGAKELRRQRRRLADLGRLVHATAEDDGAVRADIERFLALEAAGWKGAARTAMLSSSARTAFLRTATRMLVRRGLCRVDSLTVDGAPVAMAVTLSAGGAEFLWKIAYREDVARTSPGVQLVLAITETRLRDGRPMEVDSCAVPAHPMIDRLWRGRIRLCDAAVALRPGRPGAFRRAVAIERGARRLRATAKRLVLAWSARRVPARG